MTNVEIFNRFKKGVLTDTRTLYDRMTDWVKLNVDSSEGLSAQLTAWVNGQSNDELVQHVSEAISSLLEDVFRHAEKAMVPDHIHAEPGGPEPTIACEECCRLYDELDQVKAEKTQLEARHAQLVKDYAQLWTDHFALRQSRTEGGSTIGGETAPVRVVYLPMPTATGNLLDPPGENDYQYDIGKSTAEEFTPPKFLLPPVNATELEPDAEHGAGGVPVKPVPPTSRRRVI